MMVTDVKPNYKKALQRTYSATREQVFAAWTKPELLQRWFMPNERWQDPKADIDLRVGGKFRIVMTHNDGDEFIAIGVYEVIQAPSKLAFTWTWEAHAMESNPTPDTLVTIDLVEVAGGTQMTLSHERFATPEEADSHDSGWSGMLDTLGQFLAAN
jgi:uncharacterized protein YndB with AHSA1/START domain